MWPSRGLLALLSFGSCIGDVTQGDQFILIMFPTSGCDFGTGQGQGSGFIQVGSCQAVTLPAYWTGPTSLYAMLDACEIDRVNHSASSYTNMQLFTDASCASALGQSASATHTNFATSLINLKPCESASTLSYVVHTCLASSPPSPPYTPTPVTLDSGNNPCFGRHLDVLAV